MIRIFYTQGRPTRRHRGLRLLGNIGLRRDGMLVFDALCTTATQTRSLSSLMLAQATDDNAMHALHTAYTIWPFCTGDTIRYAMLF